MHRAIVVTAHLFFVLILTTPAGLLAQDEHTVEKQTVRNEGEVSYINTSGNTEVQTLSVKNRLEADLSARDMLTWKTSALYAESDGEKTAEQYATSLRWDHSYSDRTFSYLHAGWNKDEFKGIDNRYYGGIGAGYKILVGPSHFWMGEAGVDWAFEDYTRGGEDNFPRGRMFTEYEHKFTEDTSFVQSVEGLMSLVDAEDYRVISETSVVTALTEILSLKTSYEVAYDNLPEPETLDETDTVFRVALVINI
ncbi:MAG: YdiY family protein [Desulfatibacillaceae bacterium]